MKTPKSTICRYGNGLLVVAIIFLLQACIFPTGVKYFKNSEPQLAKPLMVKSQGHRYYDPGARFYLGRIRETEEPNTLAWLEIHQLYCDLEAEVNLLSKKNLTKLNAHDAGRSDIRKARENLQKRIIDRMYTGATIADLQALERNSGCLSDDQFDELRLCVVNRLIDPDNCAACPEKRCDDWEVEPLVPPTSAEIAQHPDQSCTALLIGKQWSINYEDAQAIAKYYQDDILVANYENFWEIRSSLWDIFQMHHSYCEMDRFKEEQKDNPISRDCWFDTARDTLCLGQLRPLLAFHRNNPHTGLDRDICKQILCLQSYAPDANDLNPEEEQQVEDIRSMLDLQLLALDCDANLDATELINKVEHLSKKYQHHRFVFDLAWVTTNYFVKRGELDLARKAMTTFRPLFPDASVCSATDFYFQVDKQAYFDRLTTLLQQHEMTDSDTLTVALPTAAEAWNTSENDEYGLVSYGETNEVFFVRHNPVDDATQVMTSHWKDEKWTTPVPVEELSIAEDIIPLSISGEGRTMLLRSQGGLLITFRPAIGRHWLKPQPMKTDSRFAGNAWLSPNDSLLLQEYYTGEMTALRPPPTDIAVSKLLPQGGYGKLYSIGDSINITGVNDAHPTMALGGRLFLFSSDRKGSLGQRDMYSATMNKPWDWSTASAGRNLGIQLNTIFDDEGVTYFSEYTGKAYFDRYDPCEENKNIWHFKLGPGVFPENAMRLAGKIIDENGEAIAGGFVEFTPNHQSNVHAQTISAKGTYTYTVPDSTEVVRLFPEVPGYYSERDTTHFLAKMPKGEIVRDTFVLLSFDHIRRTFELVHSTFYNGRSEFDQPKKAYPELTRLAKIGVRMGADIELTGHTDGTGAESGNKQLSIDRATSVKRYLVEKCGFDPARIRVYGYGASRPVCDNDTEEGRRCNRRVEVVFKMPDLP